jgi:hypothetical protein
MFDQALGFISKHRYGKIAATVWTMWIPVWTRSSIRQVSQFKSRRPDTGNHGPGVHQIWKLRASDQPSGRSFPRSGRAKPLYGNYLQWTCDRPDDSATPSKCGSQTGKIFKEIFIISVVQLSVQTAYDHRSDDAQFYQARHSFELLAYK